MNIKQRCLLPGCNNTLIPEKTVELMTKHQNNMMNGLL